MIYLAQIGMGNQKGLEIMRKSLGLGSVVALAAAVGVGMASPAGASVETSATPSATSIASAWAPSCVTRIVYPPLSGPLPYQARLINNCGKTMRLRVKWQFSYSDCRTFTNGQARQFASWNPYDGTQTC